MTIKLWANIFVTVLSAGIANLNHAMQNPGRIILFGPTHDITLTVEHAKLSKTIRKLLADTSIDTAEKNKDGILRLPMPLLDHCLPLIEPYFWLASSNKTGLMRAQLQKHDIPQLCDLINAFNYLDIEAIYTPALDTLAERMVKKDQFYACLKDASGSYHLPLSGDMQHLLTDKMVSGLGHTKGTLLLNYLLFKHGQLPSKEIEIPYDKLNYSLAPFIRLFFNRSDELFAANRSETSVKIANFKKPSNSDISDSREWAPPSYCTPDGKMAAGSEGSTICLWDATTKERIRTLHGHSGNINTLCFNIPGTLLASASDDGTVKLWDSKNGALLHSVSHNGRVGPLSFNSDSTLLASAATYTNDFKIWALKGKTLIPRHRCNNRPFNVRYNNDSGEASLQFTALDLLISTKFITAAPYDRNYEALQLWNPKLGVLLATLPCPVWYCKFVCVNAEGTLVAFIASTTNIFGRPKEIVKVYALADSQLAHLFAAKKMKPEQLALLEFISHYQEKKHSDFNISHYPGFLKILERLPQQQSVWPDEKSWLSTTTKLALASTALLTTVYAMQALNTYINPQTS